MIETVERLIGARPGQKLEVNFRAIRSKTAVRRAGRRLTLGLIAAASGSPPASRPSTTVADWVPITFGVLAGVLTVGCSSTWCGGTDRKAPAAVFVVDREEKSGLGGPNPSLT